jgi:hypothetical protein
VATPSLPLTNKKENDHQAPPPNNSYCSVNKHYSCSYVAAQATTTTTNRHRNPPSQTERTNPNHVRRAVSTIKGGDSKRKPSHSQR